MDQALSYGEIWRVPRWIPTREGPFHTLPSQRGEQGKILMYRVRYSVYTGAGDTPTDRWRVRQNN